MILGVGLESDEINESVSFSEWRVSLVLRKVLDVEAQLVQP